MRGLKILLVLIFMTATWASAQLSTGIQLGQLAPDFRLVDLAGKPVSLADFRGRPLVLNFWASWCPPCKAEMPLFQQVSDEVNPANDAGNKLQFFLVNLSEGRNLVADFLKANDISLTVGLDVTRAQKEELATVFDSTVKVFQAYRGRGLPTSYFIDADGVIRGKKVGQVFETELSQFLSGIGVSWQP